MSSPGPLVRQRFLLRGAVQGVGFRPFVFRLATQLRLGGWISNSNQGVLIEVEGPPGQLDCFRSRLLTERPPLALIQACESSLLPSTGETRFEIRPSDSAGLPSTIVLPDIATCPDCLRDILDPANRRFRYPFTNCTHCGPRFSLIEALPYDRPQTSMRHFALCSRCRAEYDNPVDRRFHAQPNACPDCGPHLAWWDAAGRPLATRDQALQAAIDAIRAGQIVAVKGLGGFHLLASAHLEETLRRLRFRKHREEKPLALMVPSVAHARRLCHVSDLEESLLSSPQAPIVLLQRRAASETGSDHPAVSLAVSVAPGNPCLGVMLPYTPLHHLLLRDLGFPVVATSGNRSDEPICIDEEEARERLAGIADAFLVHNRPIVRHVDDSIVRVVADRELVLRRARGYAPLPVQLTHPVPPSLATGGFLKNTVAVARGTQIFLSQHIGDLETPQAVGAFQRVASDLQAFYAVHPQYVACDRHPDYPSTRLAPELGPEVMRVQHHHAHVLACLAEHGLNTPALGVAWDGTGLGDDGDIWGGEFLLVSGGAFQRFAHLRTFRLPGGDAAAREPRRSGFAVLFEVFGAAAGDLATLGPVAAFSPAERQTIGQLLARGLHAPRTSSAGRLFDAIASLLDLRQVSSFEGQAAMELEFLADASQPEPYPIGLREAGDAPPAGPVVVIDWEPMLRALLEELAAGLPRSGIAARFHETLVEAIVQVAMRAGQKRVALSGGCFQNARLLERAIVRLRSAGFQPLWPRFVPPNDAGIALGQLVAAAAMARAASPAPTEGLPTN